MSLSEETVVEEKPKRKLKHRSRCPIKTASARRAVQRVRQRTLYEEGLKNNAAVELAHRKRLAERNAARDARRESVRGGVV